MRSSSEGTPDIPERLRRDVRAWVLCNVPELDLAVMNTQTQFTCDGRKRFVDFTLEEGNHVRLTIEVDGWDKTGRGAGMTRGEFADWLLREGCLREQGWTVLRFANSQVARDPPASFTRSPWPSFASFSKQGAPADVGPPSSTSTTSPLRS